MAKKGQPSPKKGLASTARKRTRSNGKGSVYRTPGRKIWMLTWWALDGTRQFKSSGTVKKGDAERALDDILSNQNTNVVNVTSAKLSLTFQDAADALTTRAKLKGLKSVDETERRIRLHLEPFFGANRLMVSIDTDMVNRYALKRQADTIVVSRQHNERTDDGIVTVPEVRKPVAAGEINRELTVLSGMFSTVAAQRGFRHRPVFPKLKEADPRQGFFTRDEVDAVCQHLPDELAAVVRFGYITAWRSQEVLGLTWDRIDFSGRGRVWLDGSMTKNGQPRTFKMTTDLRTLLEARKVEADNLKKSGRIVAAVFFRERLVKQPDGAWLMEKGQPILSFIKAWRAACVAAGLPGRIYHDLRRSAIRNFVRAGVSESVSMKLSGHLTASTFRRYNITADSDLDDAADKLDVAVNAPVKSEKRTARVHRLKKSA